MKSIRTLDITTLDMGPKMIYQCNCACPKGTQAHIAAEPSGDSTGQNTLAANLNIPVEFEIKSG